MPIIKCIGLLALLFCFVTAEAGTISGTIDMGKRRAAPKMKKRYGGGAEKLLAPSPPKGAVVYLEGKFSAEQLKPPEEMPKMMQAGLQFMPAVMPVVVGTTVSFPNMDPVYHNVFSYTKDKRFDLGRFQQGEEAPTVTFDTPGEVKVYCEIHSHMNSTIFVVNSPYFTVSKPDGTYKLENVPAGDYTLKAWVNSRLKYEQKVTVSADGSIEVNLAGS